MRGFRLQNVVGRKVVGVFTAVFEVIGDSIVALLVLFMVLDLCAVINLKTESRTLS